MTILTYINESISWLLGWPLIGLVVFVSVICTVSLRFVQIRYFLNGCKTLIFPAGSNASSGDMTPLQAFINTLSTNLGNGSIAGMATAIHMGGPGAALWVLIFGIILMSVRFAEVYLSTYFGAQVKTSKALGGPMLYLLQIPGGASFAYLYAVSCFLFGLAGGNAVQTNSIRVSIETTWGISPSIVAIMLLIFMIYVIFGGAERIVKFSERIVFLKVLVFFVPTLSVLIYHYQGLLAAMNLIFCSAFSSAACAGGLIGFSIQQAMRYGMGRSIFATESGLGTAAILFGFTGNKDAVSSAVMGMISTFVSTVVCFLVAVAIIVSGVWNSGADSAALTIAAYSTVFGVLGGWIVSFLAVVFGIGVMVSYAYITRACWLFLTNGRYEVVFTILYPLSSCAGALIGVQAVWGTIEIINGAMLVINLLAIVYLIPLIVRGLTQAEYVKVD